MSWKKKETGRGFSCIEFSDTYGANCTIQESSSAAEDCVWLGVSDANPVILASKAHLYGIDTSHLDEVSGWIPYPIPDDVLLTTRMHLNREQAKELVKHLKNFIKNGDLR